MTYYDFIAKGYNELYGEEQIRKWKIVKSIVKFSKKDIVLDLGCGTGIIIPELSKFVKIVVGLDNSIEMLKLAPKLKNVLYILSDAKDIPFTKNFFDKTISVTFLQDVKNWDPILKEVKRVTKGEVLITFLKRNKKLEEVERKFLKYFEIKKVVEEDKDYIFLLK